MYKFCSIELGHRVETLYFTYFVYKRSQMVSLVQNNAMKYNFYRSGLGFALVVVPGGMRGGVKNYEKVPYVNKYFIIICY